MNFIIFNDKSVLKVSQKQADEIIRLSTMPNQTGIKLNGNFYKFSQIAKVLDEKEYYRQYPDKKPNLTNYTGFQDSKALDTGKEPIQKYATNKGTLNGILKGLKKFVKEKGEENVSPSTIAQINKYENRLEMLNK